jgi:hypothetical protein
MHHFTVRIQIKVGRVRSYFELLCNGRAFAFFHIQLIANEIGIIIISYFFRRENIPGHTVAGAAPGGEAVNEDKFILFFGLGFHFIESAVEKMNARLILRAKAGAGNEEEKEYFFQNNGDKYPAANLQNSGPISSGCKQA